MVLVGMIATLAPRKAVMLSGIAKLKRVLPCRVVAQSPLFPLASASPGVTHISLAVLTAGMARTQKSRAAKVLGILNMGLSPL